MSHHDFDPLCDCEQCPYINLALQESPPRVDPKPDDFDALAERAGKLLAPPRAESDRALARSRVRLFPDQVVEELLEQRAVVEHLRAQVVVARDLARQHRHELESLRGCLFHGQFDEAEQLLADALSEVTVDDALAGAETQVSAALARAGEAVLHG